MFHYPPAGREESSELWDMVREAGVRHVVYGHLHGHGAQGAFECQRDGLTCRCVSADKIGFEPVLLFEHHSRAVGAAD